MLPLSTTRSGDIVNPDSINWPVAVVPLMIITGVRLVASLYGIKHLLKLPAVSNETESAVAYKSIHGFSLWPSLLTIIASSGLWLKLALLSVNCPPCFVTANSSSESVAIVCTLPGANQLNHVCSFYLFTFCIWSKEIYVSWILSWKRNKLVLSTSY